MSLQKTGRSGVATHNVGGDGGVYACLHEILFRHHENFIFGLRY